jgi:ATP-dependent Clp protease ATP-binding subunit ClpC
MNGYNFTDRVRRALALAREWAARLNHEYVGTEHALLGIISEGEGVASTVLRNLGVEPNSIEQKLLTTIRAGRATGVRVADLPYTSRAKKALELAMQEAKDLNHSYVGTEHLLIGLLAEEKGIAAQVLVDSGVTLDAARSETMRVLGVTGPDRPAALPFPRAEIAPPPGTLPASITLALLYPNGARTVKHFGSPSDAILFLDELGR